jgi:hypothetical protein
MFGWAKIHKKHKKPVLIGGCQKISGIGHYKQEQSSGYLVVKSCHYLAGYFFACLETI